MFFNFCLVFNFIICDSFIVRFEGKKERGKK